MMTPNMPIPRNIPAILESVKMEFLNKCKGITGLLTLCSIKIKAIKARAEYENNPMICIDDHA
jgi:hypothetical protein